MDGERRNIVAAFAQRRHMNFDRVQPEKQVFPELTRGTCGLQVGIRGGDEHAHRRAVNVKIPAAQSRPTPARAAVSPAGGRHISNFVEEDRAAVGQFEASNAVGSGVSKCAFDVPKEFAFEDSFRQRAGVDGDQRT